MKMFLTKAITIVALTCFLVVGAAATAILGRDTLFAAHYELAAAPTAVQLRSPTRKARRTSLAIATMALAAYEPPQAAPVLSEPLRQAYASTAPADLGIPKVAAPAMAPAAAPPKPKAAAKPTPQKNYALLSDIQIAGIKERLKLSASQNLIGRRWRPR